MSPMPLPLTALMRHLTVAAFLVSLIALIATLAGAAMNGFDDFYETFPVVAFWFLGLIFSVIAYQVCRLREEGQPGDETAVLLMAALAEIKAIRSQQAKVEPDEPEGDATA